MVMTEAVLLVGIGLMFGFAAAASFVNLAAKLLFWRPAARHDDIRVGHVDSRSGRDCRGLHSCASRN
jgi:hypothetical protein